MAAVEKTPVVSRKVVTEPRTSVSAGNPAAGRQQWQASVDRLRASSTAGSRQGLDSAQSPGSPLPLPPTLPVSGVRAADVSRRADDLDTRADGETELVAGDAQGPDRVPTAQGRRDYQAAGDLREGLAINQSGVGRLLPSQADLDQPKPFEAGPRPGTQDNSVNTADRVTYLSGTGDLRDSSSESPGGQLRFGVAAQLQGLNMGATNPEPGPGQGQFISTLSRQDAEQRATAYVNEARDRILPTIADPVDRDAFNAALQGGLQDYAGGLPN